MPDMTAQEMVTASYRKIGIINPNSQKLADGLQDLQNMLSLWSVKGLLVPDNVTETLTLTQGQAVYTIGDSGGADFDTVRPVRLISAFFRIDTTDFQINVKMTQLEYSRIRTKSLEIRPRNVYYDPQYPNAQLKFDYEADAALAMHLTSEKILAIPTTLATTFSIPLEYNEPIIYNLSLRLSPDKNSKIHPSVFEMAARGMEIIEGYNAVEKLSDPIQLDRAIVFGPIRRGGMNHKRGF